MIPAAVYSQGSGSSAPTKARGKSTGSNFVVARSVTGVVDTISDGSVAVENSKGDIITLSVTKTTRLGSGCMTVGRRVTIVYSVKDKRATSVRCK